MLQGTHLLKMTSLFYDSVVAIFKNHTTIFHPWLCLIFNQPKSSAMMILKLGKMVEIMCHCPIYTYGQIAIF